MKISVASGKGGTGKTLVAVNLAFVASENGASTAYLDCDVEAPNGHLFFRPRIDKSEPVHRMIPSVDENKCRLCGDCAELCRYNSIVCVGEQVLVFPDLCQSCGGCLLVCPTGAISEVPHELGLIEIGSAGSVEFVHGKLKVGESKSPPLIKKVKEAAPEVDLIIVDTPPGTSCPVVESIRASDFVLLVTEPTPFGLHDLKLAVEMVRALELPFGVVLNRADIGDERVRSYCRAGQIEILAEIPEDREIAGAYSRGEILCRSIPKYKSLFVGLWNAVRESETSK
ncbi:MAG: ATP-binding protein [Candidatus Omnitrophica bacterium]|nr:ATP-binding protein [Candidatus Omnitrophota bacterium]